MPTALCAALLLVPAHAQVVPAAHGPRKSLWIGAEYSNISASFPYQSDQRLQGAGIFAVSHLNPYIGIEGDARFLHFGGFEGSTENNYLAGLDGFFLERERFRPYGKFLVGVGQIHYPFAIGNASYFAMAPGAGTEYRMSRSWMVRVEYEYQIWPNSPGYANEPNHMLMPNGFHIGFAYRVLR
jgi:opacity protein-like surface antigen